MSRSRSRTPKTPARLAPARGHVDVFQVSDEKYYDVYLDGEHREHIAKQTPASYLLSSRERQALAQKAGVNEADLRFSFSQPLYRAMALGRDFGDMSYAEMLDWRTKFPNQWDFYALPIEEVELKLVEMGG